MSISFIPNGNIKSHSEWVSTLRKLDDHNSTMTPDGLRYDNTIGIHADEIWQELFPFAVKEDK